MSADSSDDAPDVTDAADLPGWVRVFADYARAERDAHRQRVDNMFDEGYIDRDGLVEGPDDLFADASRWLAVAREFYERFGTDYTNRDEYDVTWDADAAPFPDAQFHLQTLAAMLVMTHRGCDKCRTPRRDDGRIYLVPAEDDDRAVSSTTA